MTSVYEYHSICCSFYAATGIARLSLCPHIFPFLATTQLASKIINRKNWPLVHFLIHQDQTSSFRNTIFLDLFLSRVICRRGESLLKFLRWKCLCPRGRRPYPVLYVTSVFVCCTACLSAFQELFAARLNWSTLRFQKRSEDLHLNCLKSLVRLW